MLTIRALQSRLLQSEDHNPENFTPRSHIHTQRCEEAAAGCNFIFVTDSHNKSPPPQPQFERSLGVSRVFVSKQLVEQTKENTLRPPTRNLCVVASILDFEADGSHAEEKFDVFSFIMLFF